MVNIIRRRDPLESSMLPTMNRLMSEFFGEPLLGQVPQALAAIEEGTLPLDISEDEKHVIVRASLPGFKPENINVEVQNGILTINAQQSEEKEETGERFYRRERRFGALSRRVALPSTVDDQATEAELVHGELTLRIPKSEEAKPRRVQIKQGNGEHKPVPQGKPGQTKANP